MDDNDDSLKKVFDDGIHGIHQTKDVLARLFRMLIWRTNMPYTTWVTLLNKWVVKTSPPGTDKTVRHTCGNLSKALKKKRISWKMFLKAVAISEIDSMDITVVFKKGNKTIELSVVVDDILGMVQDFDKEDSSKAAVKLKKPKRGGPKVDVEK